MSDMNEDNVEMNLQSSRRSLRPRKISSKAIESAYMKKLKATMLVESSNSSESEDDTDYESLDTIEKPSVLNSANTIEGDKIFTFQKRKMRASLAQKVLEVKEQILPKTPRNVRNKIKKKITADILYSSSEHDFSDSGSEYVASDSSASSESEENSQEDEKTSEEDSDDTSRKASRSKKQIPQPKVPSTPSVRTSGRKRQPNRKYFIKTDDYFTNHSSKKILTSNHTLDKLETPRLPQDQLKVMLEKLKLTSEHENCIETLSSNNRSYFNKWLHLLQENFSVLLYGLGCKRHIMQEFQGQCLQDSPVIVVNGFFPTITIKDILDGIIVDLLELKENPANPYEACDLIEREFNYYPDTHLYLIVHNIEGEMLRSKKSQDVLARLAAMKNIHLVASIDHINAPLIWDHAKLSKFNYSWWDVTSFLPYIEETSFESSLLVQGVGTLALSSLRNVFLSLTTNSKGIYLIIVKYQLENGKNQYYQGLAFKDLYWSCREAFLVSSDLALRAQLNEFVDHKMVKYRRSVDGTEYLVIPIASPLLKKFLDEQVK